MPIITGEHNVPIRAITETPSLMTLIFGRCITNGRFRQRALKAKGIKLFPDVYGYTLDSNNAEDQQIFDMWFKEVRKVGINAVSDMMDQLHNAVCCPDCPCDRWDLKPKKIK